MACIKTESINDYDLREKIYERKDGTSLYFAKKKKGGAECIIRIRKDGDKTLKTIFSNEQLSLKKSAKLKPYVFPIYSKFSSDGNNYIVYKNPVGPKLDSIVGSPEFSRDEEKLKSLVTQYCILLRKLNKRKIFPVENSLIENVVANQCGKQLVLQMIGFENAIPEKGSKEGITSDVCKIAKNSIGLRTNYIQAASFIYYLFTGENPISSGKLNIQESKVDDEDALELIKECAEEKTEDDLKDFNPFKTDYLKHEPEVDVDDTHLKIDDLEFNWEEESSIKFAIGEVELVVNTEESSFSITEGKNEVTFSADSISIKGEVEDEDETKINTVEINAEGVKLAQEKGDCEVTINADGLHTQSESGELTIDGEGLKFNGKDGSGDLTIGEKLECTIQDYKVEMNPFAVKTPPLSLTLSKSQVGVTIADGIDVSINKGPSLEIESNGTVLSLNGDSPISVTVGSSVTFDLNKSSLDINMNGVDIIFEGGNISMDNDFVTMSIGKDGPQFLTYGVPFDMKSLKQKSTFPKITFPMPEIELPEIPGLPEIPKDLPGGAEVPEVEEPEVDVEKPDIGGCCTIF